jgi:hypothetical protein
MIPRMILRAIVPVVCTYIALQSLPAGGQDVKLQPLVELAFNQALARIGSNGNLQVLSLDWKPVYKEVQETYTVDHQIPEQIIDPTTKKPKTIYKTVSEAKVKTRKIMMLVPQKSIHELGWGRTPATEIGGGPVESEALRERLAKPFLVLISYDGKPIPDSFAMLFKPGTLILDLSNAPELMPPPPSSPGGVAPPLPAAAAPAPALVPAPAPALAPASVASDQSQGEFVLPQVLPPIFRLASVDERRQFVLRVVSSTENPVTRFVMKTETKLVDGKEVITSVCQPVSVLEHYEASVTTRISPDLVTGRTVEGKPMADLHLNALKQREIAVVVSRDGMPVDAFWLQNIKPKVLVLVPPASQVPPPPSASTSAPQPR